MARDRERRARGAGRGTVLRAGVQVVAGNNNWSTSVFGTTSDHWHSRSAIGRWRRARLKTPWTSGSGQRSRSSARPWPSNCSATPSPIGPDDPHQEVPLTVIGVLARKGQNSCSADQDDTVVVPISSFMAASRAWAAGCCHRLDERERRHEHDEDAEDNIRALLRQRHRLQAGQDDDFSIRNLTEMLAAQEESSRVMTLLLAAVAGVSLIVGGIGIMNIMLVSDRAHPAKSACAWRWGRAVATSLSQFLIEAVTLSVSGGAIGVVVGARDLGRRQVRRLAGGARRAGGRALCGRSAAVGVFFGFLPGAARVVAAADPGPALRVAAPGAALSDQRHRREEPAGAWAGSAGARRRRRTARSRGRCARRRRCRPPRPAARSHRSRGNPVPAGSGLVRRAAAGAPRHWCRRCAVGRTGAGERAPVGDREVGARPRPDRRSRRRRIARPSRSARQRRSCRAHPGRAAASRRSPSPDPRACRSSPPRCPAGHRRRGHWPPHRAAARRRSGAMAPRKPRPTRGSRRAPAPPGEIGGQQVGPGRRRRGRRSRPTTCAAAPT